MKKNDKNMFLGGLLLLIAGLALHIKNQRGKGGADEPLDPNMDLKPYKKGGLNLIAEAMKDSAFRDKARLLQSKMNLYFVNHPEKEFPNAPLDVDGLIGDNSIKAIVYIFGEQLLPIKDKSQIDYFIKTLK
jgi:hypothetical protein